MITAANLASIMRAVATVTHEHTTQLLTANALLLKRIEVLEARPIPLAEKGEPGRDGKDAEVDLDALAMKVAWLIPAPKDGRDGIDGTTGPAGPLGKKGLDGVAGRDGQPGVPGVAGRDGVDGKDGATGQMGEKGLDGKDGRDGTLENLKIERLDERTFQFQFKDGTPVEGGTIRLNHPVFEDTYKEGTSYSKGSLVQWDGSGWIALIDNPPMKPGIGKPEVTGWKLWIKRGNDGKPGTKGMDGKDGKPGPPGRDGTRSY